MGKPHTDPVKLKFAVGQVFVLSIVKGAGRGAFVLKLMGNNPKSMRRAVAPQARAINFRLFILQ